MNHNKPPAITYRSLKIDNKHTINIKSNTLNLADYTDEELKELFKEDINNLMENGISEVDYRGIPFEDHHSGYLTKEMAKEMKNLFSE
jgi:uncharacterized membrane-anchored protein